MKNANTVKLTPYIDELLTELSEHRKNTNQLVKKKIDIVAELIMKLYKQEIGVKHD